MVIIQSFITRSTHLVGEGRNGNEKTGGKGELPVVEAELGNKTSILLLLLC